MKVPRILAFCLSFLSASAFESNFENEDNDFLLADILGSISLTIPDSEPGGSQSAASRWTGGLSSHMMKFNTEQTALRLLLNSGQRVVIPNADGTFVIPEVPIGSHILDVIHPTLLYETVVLDVVTGHSDTGDLVVRVHPSLYSAKTVRGSKLKYPLGLKPWNLISYSTTRNKSVLLAMLTSPFVLIGFIVFGSMWLIPMMQQSSNAIANSYGDRTEDDEDLGALRLESPFLAACRPKPYSQAESTVATHNRS